MAENQDTLGMERVIDFLATTDFSTLA